MQALKKAREQLAVMLRAQQSELRSELWRNKWEMRQLVEKQTIAKRKRAELSNMIYMLESEEIKDVKRK